MKSARLGLALTAGLVAASAGYFALVAPNTAGKVADQTSIGRPAWALAIPNRSMGNRSRICVQGGRLWHRG